MAHKANEAVGQGDEMARRLSRTLQPGRFGAKAGEHSELRQFANKN
jgi:hypothetical protein